jgi:predicted phage baseplate assembly protein
MAQDSLSSCGCCDSAAETTVMTNPPGLSTIAYRLGTHPDLLRRLLAQLPLQAIEDSGQPVRRPLAALTTRSSDDPAIAVLDAWAVVADIVTFYQERIANESFLRTATERRSILELARLIGYELSPGVAASAFLSFATDAAAGAPDSVVVPAGTRVQSVPGQGQLPQTFETAVAITARLEWNTMRPRLLRPQQLAVSGDDLYLLGGGTADLTVGDTYPLDLGVALPSSGPVAATRVDVIYADGIATNLSPGAVLLLAGRRSDGDTTATVVKTVHAVEAQPELSRTRIELDSAVSQPTYQSFTTSALSSAGIAAATLDAGTVDDVIVGQTWSEGELSAWMSVQGWDAGKAVQYIYGTYSVPPPRKAGPSDPGAFAMRATLGFFGHNAPAFGALTDDARSPFVSWDKGMSIWKDTFKSSTDATTAVYYTDADCFLERSVPGVTSDGWAVLERPTKQYTAFRVTSAAEASLVGYSMSTKTTGLNLAAADTGVELSDTTADKPESFDVRKTSAHVLSDRLSLAQLPIDDPLGVGTGEAAQLTLDRMVLNLRNGQLVSVTGERDDLPGVEVSEVVAISRIEHAGGFTTVFFAAPGLTYRYVRSTVTLCANVAAATHGETVREVLGSGAGTASNQAFVLKKPPLTYVSSTRTSGTQSTLDVRVEGVSWAEVPRLYGSGPRDEQYLVRHADDGTVAVVFGDGVQGARLPTGVENVVATYRSGIGSPGMVPAQALTLLMSKPLGVATVTNPLPATGAADPEARDDARRNAPLTVLTMERVVSVRDAENFTRAFTGIGKCTATAITRNGAAWVHLTVAAAEAPADPGGLGSAVADHRLDSGAPLRSNLVAALAAACEPSMRVRVDTYQPLFFNLTANLLIDERYRWDDVHAAVTSALVEGFGFDSRSFGQPVTVTEVVTTIQRTPGVVFVDLDSLYRFDLTPSLPADGLLTADEVTWPDDSVEPSALAQLLLVNPLGVTLTQTHEAALS